MIAAFYREVILCICMVSFLHSVRRDVADDALLRALGGEELQALVKSGWHNPVLVNPRPPQEGRV